MGEREPPSDCPPRYTHLDSWSPRAAGPGAACPAPNSPPTTRGPGSTGRLRGVCLQRHAGSRPSRSGTHTHSRTLRTRLPTGAHSRQHPDSRERRAHWPVPEAARTREAQAQPVGTRIVSGKTGAGAGFLLLPPARAAWSPSWPAGAPGAQEGTPVCRQGPESPRGRNRGAACPLRSLPGGCLALAVPAPWRPHRRGGGGGPGAPSSWAGIADGRRACSWLPASQTAETMRPHVPWTRLSSGGALLRADMGFGAPTRRKRDQAPLTRGSCIRWPDKNRDSLFKTPWDKT